MCIPKITVRIWKLFREGNSDQFRDDLFGDWPRSYTPGKLWLRCISQLAIRALQTQSLVSCLLVMVYDVLSMMFYFSEWLPGILSFPVNKFQFKTHQKYVWLTVNNMCCIFSWWDSYGMLFLLSSFSFILWLHNL